MPFLDILAAPFITLKNLLTPGEDYWTWITLDGKVYENVVLVKIDSNEVTIRHTFGLATIAKTNLNERVRHNLIHDLDTTEPLDAYGLEGDYLNSFRMGHDERLGEAA